MIKKVILIFLVSMSAIAGDKLCIVLKKTTDYNHYVQRIEDVFKAAIDKKLYKVVTFKHDSSFESLKKVADSVTRENCKTIFGGISSSDSIKILKLLNNPKIHFVTPTSSSVELKKIHSNVTYMSLDDEYVAKSLFEKTVNVTGSILIVRNISFPNTRYISSMLYELLIKRRDDVVVIDILKGGKIKLDPKLKKIENIIIPSYEKDVIKVHNEFKTTRGKTFFAIDAWGTNSSILKKFVGHDKNMNIIKLDYWNNNVCNKDSFVMICKKAQEKYPNKGFDSFMAIAYDSAIFLNSLKRKKDQNFMTMQVSKNGTAVKKAHFYQINKLGVRYLEQ